MSDVPGDEQADPQREPTEEELRAYLGQLRAAPVEQVLAEVATALINAAQVKLGRADARLLLDTLGAMADQLQDRLPGELPARLGNALAQLRLAQVDAEKQVADARSEGHEESGDIAGAAGDTAGTADPAGQAPPPQTPQTPGSSRLWTPGR